MSSFNQSPKKISEVALNLKLPTSFKVWKGQIYPQGWIYLIFVPGTERSFTMDAISVRRLSLPLVWTEHIMFYHA